MTYQIKDISGKYLENVTPNSLLNKTISDILFDFDYVFVDQHESGLLFAKQNFPAIFVDTLLFSLDPKAYLYVNYTSHQNQLMHDFQGLYRFVWSDKKSFIEDINIFITEVLDDDLNLAMYGSNRSLQHVDPTPPEFNFSVFFEQTFGTKSIHALQPEVNYTDKEGHRRFIDFVLDTQNMQFAVELNGERYHHPLLISVEKYRSQLFKQNSLVYDGYLVYRWSDRGMADTTKLADQMRLFFGDKSDFKSTPHYRADRKLTFERYQHQTDAIVKINQQRLNGNNTFLVVLPTGTGKTEVFIEDVRHQLTINSTFKVLAIVPSRELRKQLVSRLHQQLDDINIYDSLQPQASSEQAIFVVTSAYILRHYHSFNRKHFNYIVVDEAHRAAASGLRNALAYFTPDSLLGLTATPDRTDQQQLETIFGQYDVDLTLQQAIEQGLVPPVRAFRLESNIDFSKVRFNGKEFVKQDLNKTVLIPSRNQLIVDVVKNILLNHL
ncbi:DEAD/DEAH box helicase [Psychrosphaera algicola]|uniref:DEAD/DEAH box helicase family protein n=1 Tax=Psychrosphaera algicola TaxID=3023714 RepID=A0ABT5FDL1_9GAMM|nr:DEAD/DEAH box helicase family protein [Psychrosphaera sp. G1-22]MDC2888697.1 DEAD/DEAH box helicase family protein [Psychrosphaera sp. G1-22]